MKTILITPMVALAFVCQSSWAASTKISSNEKVIREALKELAPNDGVGSNQYLYRGQTKDGSRCFATVNTHLLSTFDEKDPNGTSGIEVNIGGSEDGFFIGFAGEGPGGFSGLPTNTWQSSTTSVSIKMVDADTTAKFRNDWALNFTFKNKNHALEKLAAVDAREITTNESDKSSECQGLRFALKLNGQKFEKIGAAINAHLDSGSKVEIFNGCSIGKSLSTLNCGFAVDQENDEQGNAVFKVGSNGDVSFVSLKMDDSSDE